MDWSPLARLIDTHDRFLVTTHVRPDGDALGSEVGMADLLRQKGKDVRVVNVSPTPARYDFLDSRGGLFELFSAVEDRADLDDRRALVILDLSSWSQLGDMGDFVRGFRGPRIVIDHHVSEDDLGAVATLKDTRAEATGTLVYRAAVALGVTITPEMATGLLTAIAMDTGWFRHPSTTPETFRTAGALMEAGASVNEIFRKLFERSTPGRLALTGAVLSGMGYAQGGRVVHAAVTRELLDSTGALPAETEDLIDLLMSVEGAEVGLLFIEQRKGGIKLSLRSRAGYDVASLAGRFGGGGHRAAAGAMLEEPMDEAVDQVLRTVRESLNGESGLKAGPS